ncbi:MAG: PEP-CTERM sorting domain-containing protein [Planctomycetaceae bacterium]|nr:PEP-CTERM sorting domain-containing protein [Planctomycetaceae bacterium]
MYRNLIACLVVIAASTHVDAGLHFDFDYRYDSMGFFDDPARRESLELAGRLINRYVDDLEAIIPTGDNGWTSFFTPPDGSGSIFLSDLPVAEDTMQIFVAGRPLPGRLAQAVDTSPTGIGDEDWVETVMYRGETGAADTPASDFGPMGGRMSFNNDPEEVAWHFDSSTVDLEAEEFDFVTVAMHEMLHLLGIGVSRSFVGQVNFNRFMGPEAVATGSPTNPDLRLDISKAHYESGTESPWNGKLQESLIAPGIFPGVRAFPTRLDLATLRDIGWEEAKPGDANRDREFNTLDFVETFQAGLYETGNAAGWSDGDWNGNATFESGDLIEALQTGTYEQGPDAAIAANESRMDGQITVIYDPATGDIQIDTDQQLLTSIQLSSQDKIFLQGMGIELEGLFDVDRPDKIFKLGVDGFADLNLGTVAPTGLNAEYLGSDLSLEGSMLGGGGLEEVKLLVIPEPSAFFLFGIGLLGLRSLVRRNLRQH